MWRRIDISSGTRVVKKIKAMLKQTRLVMLGYTCATLKAWMAFITRQRLISGCLKEKRLIDTFIDHHAGQAMCSGVLPKLNGLLFTTPPYDNTARPTELPTKCKQHTHSPAGPAYPPSRNQGSLPRCLTVALTVSLSLPPWNKMLHPLKLLAWGRFGNGTLVLHVRPSMTPRIWIQPLCAEVSASPMPISLKPQCTNAQGCRR